MHVAIIPDGLRRWARLNGTSYDKSYQFMCEKLVSYTIECFTYDIEIVSLYLSSKENFTRTRKDIESFCMAEHFMCTRLLPEVIKNFNAKVINAGAIDLIPIYLQNSTNKLAKDSYQHRKHKLYLCHAYNPLEEVRFAFNNYCEDQDILKLLWVSDPVNILIRTGKGQLASNFLPLQCAGHAKIYSFDKLFLDTTPDDIKKILSMHNDYLANKIQSVDDLIASQT